MAFFWLAFLISHLVEKRTILHWVTFHHHLLALAMPNGARAQISAENSCQQEGEKSCHQIIKLYSGNGMPDLQQTRQSTQDRLWKSKLLAAWRCRLWYKEVGGAKSDCKHVIH